VAFGKLETRLAPTRRQRSARRASSLSCIPERYIDGREGGAETQLVEEVIDGEKTGMWVCPCCGRPYAKQFIDDTASVWRRRPSRHPPRP
jgi:hypothetical protein